MNISSLLKSLVLLTPLTACVVDHGSPEERAATDERLAPSEEGIAGQEELADDFNVDDAATEDEVVAAPAGDEDWLALSQSLSSGDSQAEGNFFGGDDTGAGHTRWTWMGDEFLSDTPVCMDGSATGMGLSLVEGATKTLVFFQGGGACFNGTTCALSDYWLTNTSFDADSFEEWTMETGQFGWFDRTREDNPYRDYNFVFLPYCSGDIFAGLNWDGPGDRVHVGYRNVGIWTDFIKEYFWDATEWTIAGSSAGGFGAAWNYSRMQEALAPAPAHLVSDAAPVLSNTYTSSCEQQKWKEAWNLDATRPAEFDGTLGYNADGSEGDGVQSMMTSIIDAYPDNRFAFVAGNEDTVLRFFFGIGHSWGCNLPWLMSKRSFRRGLDELSDVMAERTNVSTYVVPTSDHMFLNNNRMYTTSVGGEPLTDWLTEFEAGGQPGSQG